MDKNGETGVQAWPDSELEDLIRQSFQTNFSSWITLKRKQQKYTRFADEKM